MAPSLFSRNSSNSPTVLSTYERTARSQHSILPMHSLYPNYIFVKRRGNEQSKFSAKKSWRNLLLFVCLSCLSITLPYIIIRHGFGQKVSCAYESLAESDSKCHTMKSRIAFFAFTLVRNLIGIGPLVLIGRLGSNPTGKYDRLLVTSACVVVLLNAIITSLFIEDKDDFYILTIFIIYTCFGVLTDRKGYNKPGLIIGFSFLVLLLTLSWGPVYLADFFDAEIFFGQKLLIFLPLIVQNLQGLLVLFIEFMSRDLILVPYNCDAFIALVKYDLIAINGMKTVYLLKSLEEEHPFVPIGLQIVTEVFGRLQVMRILFRKLRRWFFPKYRQKPLRFLAQNLLCSDYDMTYIPILMVVLIKTFNTPFINDREHDNTHISDGFLTLNQNSVFAASWLKIFLLFMIVVGTDCLTLIMARVIPHKQVFTIREVFCQDWRKVLFYTPGLIYPALSLLLLYGATM